jgi:hypothetical protein
MKKIIFICILGLFTCNCAGYHPGVKWSARNTVLESVGAGVQIVDWMQTNHIIDSSRWYELNPILGKYPTRGELAAYMVTTLSLHFLVSLFLPEDYRTVWQSVTLGGRFGAVYYNHLNGVRPRF